MSQPFTLAACAEMLWRDRPMEWRVKRLTELGFGVGPWNWPDHDLESLERSGATFSIMNGYLRGRLTDDEGAAELLKTARETTEVGKRLALVSSVDHPRLRLNLDLYHAQIGEGNLIERTRACLPWIGEVQVADVP